ncbi:MAG TPA: trypsin-like peptidase domain-containing protein [Planctomycetaceae bacterium]
MSEAEFDSYLSLLSKFLRLRSRQRAELADELRDHLETRLDELLAEGKTRDEAVRIALEELGDAAVLAEDFSRLASRRKRRFVMRCTAASAAVVAAVVLLSLAVAPPGPNGPGPENVVAQQPAGPPADAAGGVPAIPDRSSVEQQAVAALDEKLGKVVSDVNFTETPLSTALEFVADQIEADVLLDRQALEDEGISPEEPVTLRLARTPVSARTVLEFVLEPQDLAFVNRAGVIFVTTETMAEELLTTKVYNVRDLLENATGHAVMEWVPPGGTGLGGLGGGLGGGGFFSIPDAAAASLLAAVGQAAPAAGDAGGGASEAGGQPAAGKSSSGGSGFGQAGSGSWNRRVIGPAAELIHTIQDTTSGPWFDVDGVGGTMTAFNGLLVVRQTEENHAEIQKLLDALREAGKQRPGGSVTVPKEGENAGGASVGDTATAVTVDQPPREIARVGAGLASSALGFAAKVIADPAWVGGQGEQLARRSTPLGLRVVDVADGSRAYAAGLRGGDVIVSWSADSWNASPEDANPMAFDGRTLPDPAGLEDAVARRHGAKAIIFRVVRADQEGLPRIQTVTMPVAPKDHTDDAADDRSLRSAVRLRAGGARGVDLGSGTVIGSRDGKTIVLTCWHIFRALGDAATIEGDMFPHGLAGQPVTAGGRVIASDEKADISLVELDASPTVPAASVTDVEHAVAVKPGDRVYSVGCSDGEPPTKRRHVVTRINAYQGPATIECTGVPPVGRSGAGLFDSNDRLIGVCFAADRDDERGVFAGPAEIHRLLEHAGYGELISASATAAE